MPEVLRTAGLHTSLGAEYAGEVRPGPYNPERDPELGVLNPSAVLDYSLRLGARVGQLLDQERFPLVLGGDCSVLLGCTLAVRRRGRFGLVFVDGHADHLTPQTTKSGGVAGMDLAIVTGTGVDLLANMYGLGPYIQPTDAVQLGSRDEGVRQDPDGRIHGTQIPMIGLEEMRSDGVHAAVEKGLTSLDRSGLKGVWFHLDADVMDDSVMPAVDSRQPGGLTVDELVKLIQHVVRRVKVVGMDVTIYDPDLDPSGAAARSLVEVLVAGLSY